MDPQKFVHDLRTQFFAQAHSSLEDLPEENSERLMLLCRLYADLLIASLEHESPEETVEVLHAFMEVVCAWMIDGFDMDENTYGKGDYLLRLHRYGTQDSEAIREIFQTLGNIAEHLNEDFEVEYSLYKLSVLCADWMCNHRLIKWVQS